ncbi:uncharacterized protein LOC125370487 [Ricinus communis]|uniref:uncharacterized protein LOC125370487 n=1 Tax=Ricinus communis TaxID=3988 RepID=UPI00201AE398|nr:uncharacterized protein LOC125370487 [Ricinus communis]
MCVGDFNGIMWSLEKMGGSLRANGAIRRFREAVEEYGLMNLGYEGNSFTWTNGQHGSGNIMERLDRVLANDSWCVLFPCFRVHHLVRIRSDHSPLSMSLVANWCTNGTYNRKRRKRLFRFERMWLHHEACQEIIREGWMGGTFDERVKTCGRKLMRWDKEVFGNVRRNLGDVRRKLEIAQGGSQFELNMSECRRLEGELNQLLMLEESLWLQRSRIQWLQEGDRNTTFFHRQATQRHKRNTVEGIRDDYGNWWRDEKEIARVMTDYFKNIFKSETPRNMHKVINLIESRVTTEMIEQLTQPYTPDETYRALRQMHPTKAPGPDQGLSSLITEAERNGEIHGYKVARNAPSVSHLFFADDSIIFTRANVQEAEKIAWILHIYEEAPGQKINLDKSETTTSSNVSEDRKQDVIEKLGVKQVDKHGKYLGLPTIIGKSKKEVFKLVQDRILHNLIGWKEKALSKAGKEILLKTVVQAIPTYIMSCFLFPTGVCKEIERAIITILVGL